ncbi:putative reverse transcriptase, RNA-dependent DNA polymerase [Tanacetum coccineum]|uniref:Reverse transcriptase, RNA-dependent DNA polymerase n=1 Tax=Tanacetum coccineum TaxID=301880 RepID=A0ABQ5FLC5_9ASTR
MSNALADLGASISIMPYSLFKRLGLGSLKPIRMTIEMADRSMQSPKGIKENVLVKIRNFMFPVDFVVLDIMEDENVLIILGRPMLATAHAKINVYDYAKGQGRFLVWTLCVPEEKNEHRIGKICDIDGHGIKSLREDGNNLKISAKFQISKQSSGSFLS